MAKPPGLRELLEAVARGEVLPSAAAARLREHEVGGQGIETFAVLDADRARRQGVGEVIFSQDKTPEETAAIAAAALTSSQNLLCTRASPAHAVAVQELFPEARYHERASIIEIRRAGAKKLGTVAVVCAGTSDLPVAEESAICLEHWGASVTRHFDIGVAGLHRFLSRADEISSHDVVIVAAGMEGALPSVVGGWVASPVIAVPTSVGYGASLGGLTALLSMLNSCAAGVTVVNIDNGFGAAMGAFRILQALAKN